MHSDPNNKMIENGSIEAICLSQEKHTVKISVDQAFVQKDHGLLGDAHAGPGDRQVSFLALESIQRMKEKKPDLCFGMFGENFVIRGVDISRIHQGCCLSLGEQVVVEVTCVGKPCHQPCAIFREVGFCIMPSEGIFAKVLRSGWVKVHDPIKVLKSLVLALSLF